MIALIYDYWRFISFILNGQHKISPLDSAEFQIKMQKILCFIIVFPYLIKYQFLIIYVWKYATHPKKKHQVFREWFYLLNYVPTLYVLVFLNIHQWT